MVDKIYSSRTAINWLLTGGNRRERGSDSDYRVWTETVKSGERICEEESVIELSV